MAMPSIISGLCKNKYQFLLYILHVPYVYPPSYVPPPLAISLIAFRVIETIMGIKSVQSLNLTTSVQRCLVLWANGAQWRPGSTCISYPFHLNAVLFSEESSFSIFMETTAPCSPPSFNGP